MYALVDVLRYLSVVAPFTPPTNPPKGSLLEISCSFSYQEIASQIFGSGPMSPKILVVECWKRQPISGGGVSLTFFGNCISREKVSMHYMWLFLCVVAPPPISSIGHQYFATYRDATHFFSTHANSLQVNQI